MIAPCGCETGSDKKELKEHGSVSFPAACYRNDGRAVDVPWHWHDEMEALVVEKGSIAVEVADSKYMVTEGNGCFVNAGALHMVKKSGDADVTEHCIVFHPLLVGGSRDSVFWQKYLLPLIGDPSFSGVYLDASVPWQKKMISLIGAAWDACCSEEGDYEICARNALSECIGILRGRMPARRQIVSPAALREKERMKTMLRFIQQNFHEALTVGQIASSAAVSESECMRCFRDTIGAAPIAYLKNYRLQNAAGLLRATDVSVSEIGERCGFREMSYFSRAFRSLYGVTPSQYRNLAKKDCNGSDFRRHYYED